MICPGRRGPWPFLGTGEPTTVIVRGQPRRLTVPCCWPRLAGDRYSAAYAQLMAGMAASSMTDRALARAHAAQSVELFSGIGDRRGAGYARCVLADCLSGEGAPTESLAILRTCFGVFEELLDRWGLLISTTSAALAHAALGDWRQTAFALGVADSLSERIGGHPFPAVQAAIDAIAAKTAAELGALGSSPA